MTIQIYLDMDGVLADFDSAMHEAMGEDQEKLHQDFANLGLSHLSVLDWHQLKLTFRGPQPDSSMAQAKKLYNVYRGKQYAIMGREGWFFNLNPLPWAEELVHEVNQIHRRENGSQPHILTAPVKSDFCEPEKELWMRTHFPDLYDEFHCTQDKHAHADDRSILIDDNLKFVNPFREHGGHAVHFLGNLDDALRELEVLIDSIR